MTAAREVDEAMELMSRSRPVIEQAKGALMMAYDARRRPTRSSCCAATPSRSTSRCATWPGSSSRPASTAGAGPSATARHAGPARAGRRRRRSRSRTRAPRPRSRRRGRRPTRTNGRAGAPVRADQVEQLRGVDHRLEAVGLPQRDRLVAQQVDARVVGVVPARRGLQGLAAELPALPSAARPGSGAAAGRCGRRRSPRGARPGAASPGRRIRRRPRTPGAPTWT